jgi:hypothetical protein
MVAGDEVELGEGFGSEEQGKMITSKLNLISFHSLVLIDDV